MGLFATLRQAVDDSRDDTVNDETDGDGAFWVTRNDCRTCGALIEDVGAAPTAVDRSDPLANGVCSGAPRSTFCSEPCREAFVDVFHDGGQR